MSTISNSKKIGRGRVAFQGPINGTPLFPIHLSLTIQLHQGLFKGVRQLPFLVRKRRTISPSIERVNLTRQALLISMNVRSPVAGPATQKSKNEIRALVLVIHWPKGTSISSKEGSDFGRDQVAEAIDQKPRSVELETRGSR